MKKTTRTTKKTGPTKSSSRTQRAERFVRAAARADADIWADLVNEDGYHRIFFDRHWSKEIVALEDEILKALPKSMHRVLTKYSDLQSEAACDEAEVAFTLGRAYERLAGGAR